MRGKTGRVEEISAGLEGGCDPVNYEKGEFIYLPGDPSDAVYLIKKGMVRLLYIDEDGSKSTMSILGRGELFGEMVLAEDRFRELAAEALEDSTLYVIDRWRFLHIIKNMPDLALELIELFGYRKNLLFLFDY